MISDSFTVSEAERGRVSGAQKLKDAGEIKELISMLTDPSWVVRRAVIESLSAAGDAAVPLLCEELKSKRDNEARIAALVDSLAASRGDVDAAILPLLTNSNAAVVADGLQVIGRRRSEASVPLLIGFSKHADDIVAVSAIEALGRIGGRSAVEALIETIASGSFFRTFPAIDILGRSGDRRAVEPLARLLGNSVYLPEAARALGRLGDRSAVKPLLDLFKSQSDSVVRVAAIALWDLRERYEEKAGAGVAAIDDLLRSQVGAETVRRLTRLMSGLDIPETVSICRLFGILGSSEATAMLTERLEGPALVAESAAEALKKIGKESELHLLAELLNGNSQKRKALLPVITSANASAEAAACLSDPDPEVRTLACETAARLGSAPIVKNLFSLLGDSNVRVVHAATAAIQALGTRESRILAVEAARSSDPAVRRSALRILAYFGDAIALQPILDALEDPDARVREVAIQGLPYLEESRAYAALFQVARSSDPRTRSLAMRALGQMPKAEERVFSILLRGLADPDAWVRYYSCQSLGRLNYTAAAKEISVLLQDEAGQVRVSAVEALSHLNSPESHQALVQAAKSEEADIRRAAIVGLGISHRADDLPIVLAALANSDVSTKLIALSALVNFSSPQVIAALNRSASDSDDLVRSSAIALLAGRSEPEATEALVRLLDNPDVHERARQALLIANSGRIAGLLSALETADIDLATIILGTLSKLPRPEAKAAIFSAMKLNNVAARKAAAGVLALNLDRNKTAILREAAVQDPDESVRNLCALLLTE